MIYLSLKVLCLFSYLYGEFAKQRRRWYASRPEARRRLTRPVISVGSLTIGGSGKTPVVAYIAKLLLTMGDRPSILSRGYARQSPEDGVVVVHDGVRLHADLARAGDEPLMLARSMQGVVVLVSADRYLAGRLAEARFGCSVHILDDGFQHVILERDVDLLVLAADDLSGAEVLPAGRMRERLDAGALADAVLVTGGSLSNAHEVSDKLGVSRVFQVGRALGTPQMADSTGDANLAADARVLAVAGIAQPERFFDDLKSTDFTVVRTMTFPDHHPFSHHDVERIKREARADDVELVLTTEKDLVRLLPYQPMGIPLAWMPLIVRIEPPTEFQKWLQEHLSVARNHESFLV